ncbi:MAG: hypothetical protein JW938_06380, partial [Candidatus Omnitrophica bacterium]|nr:hypothetical protein [Candidatus Omnitrophota bacterium]
TVEEHRQQAVQSWTIDTMARMGKRQRIWVVEDVESGKIQARAYSIKDGSSVDIPLRVVRKRADVIEPSGDIFISYAGIPIEEWLHDLLRPYWNDVFQSDLKKFVIEMMFMFGHEMPNRLCVIERTIGDLFGFARARDDLIAIHRAYYNDLISPDRTLQQVALLAIFHEILEYWAELGLFYFRRNGIGIEVAIKAEDIEIMTEILPTKATAALFEKLHTAKKRSEIDHYAIRILTRTMFGDLDVLLTHRNKLEQFIAGACPEDLVDRELVESAVREHIAQYDTIDNIHWTRFYLNPLLAHLENDRNDTAHVLIQGYFRQAVTQCLGHEGLDLQKAIEYTCVHADPLIRSYEQQELHMLISA